MSAVAQPEVPVEHSIVKHLPLNCGGTRFRVIEQLGKGGNSSVFLVQCLNGPHQGLLFAAKVFTNTGDDARAARFQTELEFLKEPRHPAVMRVFYSGSHPLPGDDRVIQLPYYVAEYLPRTLSDAIRSGLSITEKVSIAIQLVSALAFLEKNNPLIVHRDIKPENIFIKGRAAVLGDFGLLKSIGEPGSPNEFAIEGDLSKGIRHPRFYPTPELIEYAKGRLTELSPKSDVFQLGLVLSELFCGSSPLKERKVYDEIELDELSPVGGGEGGNIRTILGRMLAIDPDNRPLASELFDSWDGVFQRVVDDATRLEGKAFW